MIERSRKPRDSRARPRHRRGKASSRSCASDELDGVMCWSQPAQVICPSGGLLTGVSSPLCKNISLSTHPKSSLELFPSCPTRGAYHDRHGRWVRDAVDAAALSVRRDGRAGSLGACERSQARGREMLSRTAKSCGPDAPTLASSLAEVLSALPGSDKTLIRRRRWQKSPVTGESTTYAVKTIAQGMPGVPGYLWLLPLCFLHCTGGCGCSGHPAFPAPSILGED
jgi:hypothetical protein